MQKNIDLKVVFKDIKTRRQRKKMGAIKKE